MYELGFSSTERKHIHDANIWAAVIIALSLLIAVSALVAGVRSKGAGTSATSVVGIAHFTRAG
jgi:hypothetical protein